ncbi:MAG: polyhydroxyalkanoic acid system family protein [Thermoguttaceae bacterium]|jgi:hypothetical protein
MPKISLSFPHDLGKEEAIKRIRRAIETEKVTMSNIVTDSSEKWVGDDHVDWTMTIFTYPVSGTLDIRESTVDVTLNLPMAATMVTGMIKNQLEQEIAGMLKDSREKNV